MTLEIWVVAWRQKLFTMKNRNEISHNKNSKRICSVYYSPFNKGWT